VTPLRVIFEDEYRLTLTLSGTTGFEGEVKET
jgi:hypothetical protein